MTVKAVAFVPSAPLLVPVVAAGSAALDDDIRMASVQAVRRATAGCDEVVVVAATDDAGVWGGDAVADFHGFGLPGAQDGGAARGEVLPWPLGVGAWLLDASGWCGPRRYVGLSGDDRHLATDDRSSTSAVVTVGDGSACRSEKAPGYLDSRAEAFDSGIAMVLAAGDVSGLSGIDGTLAGELMCAGLLPWRWVAAALADRSVDDAELLADVAPYGVAYFAAVWLLADGSARQGRQ